MKQLFGYVFVSFLFALPLSASALGISFGGTILTWKTCTFPPGAIHITIKPAGGSPNAAYIWVPFLTLGFPPTHIGQQILGLADISAVCTVGKVPFPGQRIQLDGVGI